jgi:hypothetical protein
MSVQYICELYFDKHKSNWQELLRFSLQNLGFIPNVMSIYVTMDKMFEETPYDEDFLFSVLSEEDEPGISIRHHIYDENSENPWFRFGTEGKFVSLKWSNTNLDFLLSENIKQFLKMDGFTAGYAFDNKDIREQSREAKEKGEFDYTIYPGQYKYVCGMQFMAAPLMWFGKNFFEIISKDKLLKFNKAHINEKLVPDLVEVKLFDIYESPEKTENRINQKNFWSFFNLGKIISKFEEDNSIDAVQSLKDFLAKNQSRKSK